MASFYASYPLSGGGSIGPGTAGTLAVFTGTGTIGDSTVTDDGTNVAFTGTGTVSVTGQLVQNYNTETATAAALTLSWNTGNIQEVALESSTTLTFHQAQAGAVLYVELTQDSTGGRIVTWPATLSWLGGTPTLDTSANSVSLVQIVFDGAKYRAVLLSNAALTGLTGDVTASGPGNATTSLVATSNATLTSLSALAEVGTITTGDWEGTPVAFTYGGTGQTTQQDALNALAGTQSAGTYLRSDGTNTALSAIVAADVPALFVDQEFVGTTNPVTVTQAFTSGSNIDVWIGGQLQSEAGSDFTRDAGASTITLNGADLQSNTRTRVRVWIWG